MKGKRGLKPGKPLNKADKLKGQQTEYLFNILTKSRLKGHKDD